MMPETNDHERRDSFRLEMTAYTSHKPKHIEFPLSADYFRELESIALNSELNNLKLELNIITERIKDLATRKAIEILNSQLDIVSKLHINQAITQQELTSQSISISEGGCSMSIDVDIKEGDEVALALIFTPSYFSLFVFAQAITITDSEQPKKVHFKFLDLSERQKQLLIKTMFQVQTDAKNR